MIGAAAGIFLHAPAKFTEGHHQYPPEVALDFHVFHERFYRVAQLAEQPLLRAGLVGVGVVAALGDVEDPRGQTAANQASH